MIESVTAITVKTTRPDILLSGTVNSPEHKTDPMRHVRRAEGYVERQSSPSEIQTCAATQSSGARAPLAWAGPRLDVITYFSPHLITNSEYQYRGDTSRNMQGHTDGFNHIISSLK